MESQLEVIDAFIDGERVDAVALKRALADEAGRDYFVDTWLLREGVHEDMAPDQTLTPVIARPRGPRLWTIAAAVLVCLAGGYAAGYRAGGVLAPRAVAPIATVQDTTPAANATPPVKSFPVPVPTRVIQVDFAAVPAAGSGGE